MDENLHDIGLSTGEEVGWDLGHFATNAAAPGQTFPPTTKIQRNYVVVQSLSRVQFFCNPRYHNPPGCSLRDFPGKSTRAGYHFLLQGNFQAH